MTVARLRSATYDWSRSDDSTSSIDAGGPTLSPFRLHAELLADCLDFALHATEELIHHHASGWKQDPLPHARDHPADLTIARDAHLRPGALVGEGDLGVALDKTGATRAVDDQPISLPGLLISNLDVPNKRAAH